MYCDSVEVARKGLATACEKVVHVALHERLIRIVSCRDQTPSVGPSIIVCPLGLGSVAVSCKLSQCSTIRPSSKRKMSKPMRGPKKLYSRVSEDIVAIFKDADRIDGRIGRHVLDEGGDTCRARSHL